MLIQNLNKIIFIHGWLFGSYIWKNIQGRIPNISSSELVSLPGYHKSSSNEHSLKVIDSILGSSKKDDMIIAYSYTAARILLSSELNKCDATIILINPFLKPKLNSITNLKDNLNTNNLKVNAASNAIYEKMLEKTTQSLEEIIKNSENSSKVQ